jgi:diguanylate cyclase (GGDEF)-like protein/PAS domain S-box-containing protein
MLRKDKTKTKKESPSSGRAADLRKQAEEALRSNEELYRTILQTTMDGFWMTDMQGRLLGVNEAYCRMIGYSEQELLAMSVYDLELTKTTGDIADRIQKITEQCEDRFESQHYRKDGSIIDVEISVKYLPTGGGRLVGFLRDITERKLAEGNLQESKAKLQAIFDTVGTGIIIIDRDTQIIIEANQAAIEMTGLPQDRIIGQICHSLVCPAQVGKCPVKDLGQRIDHSERKLLHADGHQKDILKTVYPITIKGRDCYVESFIDISDRLRTEEALLESEERFDQLAMQSSTITWEMDAKGLYTYISHVSETVLGYHSDELVGRMHFFDLHSESGREAFKKAAFAIFDQKESFKNLENVAQTKDGRQVWLSTNGIPLLNADGTLRGYRGSATDITERKRTEEALQESEKRYRELRIIDGLNHPYNSRHFYFQLKSEIEQSNLHGQPLTLLLLDLDNFKAFSDAYGHIERDQVLLRLDQVVKRCLRQTDFAYRYGGEEFAILLPMTTSNDAAVTAKRIRTEFKKETFSPAPGQDVHLTMSIGLAQYKPNEEMKVFVHRVDQLMYQAKKKGKDRVCLEA